MSGSGSATFTYATWSARFPELAATVTEPLATLYWAEAGLVLDPTSSSVVADVLTRTVILNLITAHIASLNGPGSSSPGSGGRVASASEGSVSVTFATPEVPGSAAWFAQTAYGLQAWQALAFARTARYVPGPGIAYRRSVGFPFRPGRF